LKSDIFAEILIPILSYKQTLKKPTAEHNYESMTESALELIIVIA